MQKIRVTAALAALAFLLVSCAPIPPATPAAAPTEAPAATSVPAATVAPAATAAPAQSSAAMPVIKLDTQGLPYSWQPVPVPATPYNTSEPPGPKGMPQHVEILFGVTDLEHKQPLAPNMYIIPVVPYEQLWNDAGNPYISKTITSIYSWTVALQNPPPTSGLPALPPEQISGVNDVAVQIGRAAPADTSSSKSGFRFVGRWAQDANPITAESMLWYTYQGFTNDGKNLVSFWYPVTTSKLTKQADLSAAEMDKFNQDPQAYIKAQAEMLNSLAPSDWQPNLTQLDDLVGSLQIDGVPPTGLQGVVWQWTGTSWTELKNGVYEPKSNPIADPSLYTVVYTPDGNIQVKADCNSASGTYTYDGGAVGKTRVTMGPTTLAACPEGSRSQELINSLQAAQDFRVQPGGMELRLNMPAGGPVLGFENAGAAK